MSQIEDPTHPTDQGNGSPTQAKLLDAMAKALSLAAQQADHGAQLEKLHELCRRQAAAITHLNAQSRSMSARGRDLRATAEAVRESIHRTRVIALNAGLEGSRMPEPEGRALLTVGEEIRNTASQGEGALDELMTLLSQIDGDRQALSDNAERASEQQLALSERVEQLCRGQVELERQLGLLLERVSGAAGTDPEVAKLAAAASDQAQGLLSLLNQLIDRPGARNALSSFRAELGPLARLIEEFSRTPKSS